MSPKKTADINRLRYIAHSSRAITEMLSTRSEIWVLPQSGFSHRRVIWGVRGVKILSDPPFSLPDRPIKKFLTPSETKVGGLTPHENMLISIKN